MGKISKLVFALGVITVLAVTNYLYNMQDLDSAIEDGESGHEWAVRINAGEDPNQVAEAHGFTNLGQIASLEGYYLFELKEQHRKRDVASEKAKRLAEHPSITWIEEQIPRERVRRRSGGSEDHY